jgi:hypothetical protein
MKPRFRLTVPTGRLISVSPLLYAEFAFEPKKSFICNKIRRIADPNEPKQPNRKLALFCHPPIPIPATGGINHAE